MQLKPFRISPMSCLMLAATVAIVISLFAAPAFSASSNPCSSCHGSYDQRLDILEGNSQNKIPTTIQVGQTQTVTVAIQNTNNAGRYSQLTGVSLTLSSQNGRFSVNTPTYNIGTLQTGTAAATWQITGISQGSDTLLIRAMATNPHYDLKFNDDFSPIPTITVTSSSGSPPPPTPTPTPTATPTQAPTSPTPSATPTGTAPPPSSTQTPTQPPNSTPQPTSATTPSPSSEPETNPSPTPTADSTEPSFSDPAQWSEIVPYLLLAVVLAVCLVGGFFLRRSKHTKHS